MEYKSPKNQKWDGNFPGNIAAANIKKGKKIFTAQFVLDPVRDLNPEPEPTLFKVGTGTAIYHYGSTNPQHWQNVYDFI